MLKCSASTTQIVSVLDLSTSDPHGPGAFDYSTPILRRALRLLMASPSNGLAFSKVRSDFESGPISCLGSNVLAFTLQGQRNRERSLNVDESSTWMIAGKLCAFWTTVFGETFCDVGSVADVEGTVRASEDINKGGPGNRWRRFSRREIGEIVCLGHGR
jgi:hypothetical protein